MATSSSSSSTPLGQVGPIGPVGATPRLAPLWRDAPLPPGLTPGALLRLSQAPGPDGAWLLEAAEGGQALTLMRPPIDDLQPGDHLLLRVRAVAPRLELEVLEHRREGGAGSMSGERDSGWSALNTLSAWRGDLAAWRKLMQAGGAPVVATAASVPALVVAWSQALETGRPPLGPDGAPFWLLPLPYWLRRGGQGAPRDHDAGPGASGLDDPSELPALCLMLKWRGGAIGLQLQGPREALRLTLLAESAEVMAALRGELPRLTAALLRAGCRLRRLGWRQQALWVPVDPQPSPRADAGLLVAAAAITLALAEDGDSSVL